VNLPHGETITRLRGTPAANPYSGESNDLDWSSPDTLAITGCAVVEGPTTEPGEIGRNQVEVDYTIYTPYQSDILPLDKLMVRGRDCDVLGVRIDWHNPFTGDEPGSEVRARWVAG
jgi:hypothetical protein